MNRDKAISLISKLKALSTNNSSPEEAALAASRIQHLVDLYKIAQVEFTIEGEDPIESYDCYCENGVNLTKWKILLCNIIAQHNGCRIVWRGGIKLGNFIEPALVSIIGTESNVKTARYIFGYLSREIERLSAKALENRNRAWGVKGGKSWSNSFKVGAVDMICYRLNRQREDIKAESSTAMVLFVSESYAVEEWLRKNMNVRKAKTTATARNMAGYKEGVRAGGDLDLGIERTELGEGPKLLPNR